LFGLEPEFASRKGPDLGEHKGGYTSFKCLIRLRKPVIPRSLPSLLADDEEFRTVLKTLRANFLVLRPKAFGRRVAPLGMTAWKGFSAACWGLKMAVGSRQ
jgi:hypothetical protein